MKQLLFIIAALFLLQSCSRPAGDKDQQNKGGDSVKTTSLDATYMMLGVLYYQKAAENRALYYQGFNTAKMILDKDAAIKSARKKAVVLDIDETVLDNSPYEAQCILGSFGYPDKWDDWCNAAKAEPTPGCVDFLKYAVNKGYDIYYITNRKIKFADVTLKNMADKGIPMADTAHVWFRTEGNSKEGRRQKLLKTHDITLLMGDNLADFITVFDQKLDVAQRAAKTDSLKEEFGKRFIIFPNSMYGDWEMTFYSDPAASPAVKDSLRRSFLSGF
jgi:5'-nucleotidase (lipoprotein e(P4) family)